MPNNSVTACPLCDDAFENRTELRVHLMTKHRKSTLTDELIGVLERNAHHVST